ncbi:hypothetical protein GSI_05569 [Ganoderma sinense ZZ0214-1]|uniref:Retrotransposon gag domain-containing protein n=1 Tax=Ganoderma sinense ZZ0214-1 TaxID=1077348 RepID=A0A2G8SEZ2_9APHY|nr:hypothetical protein GSI_05569 [Ganoderma sinense ZZ0214-1]
MDVDPNQLPPIQNPQPAVQAAAVQAQPIMQQPTPVVQPAPVQAPNTNNNLSDAVANLSNAMATLATRTGQASKVVQKPAPFKGEQGAEARRFLAGFTMWATAQGSSLNVLDNQGLVTARRDAEWIRSVLSYLHDDAAVWASPAMEVFAIGQIPFHGVWAEFCAEFKARFESVNEVIDAKEKLRDLWQGKLTVPEYAARFRELMDRTGYGNDDLRDRFYDRLNANIKDELVHTSRPTGHLEELISVASAVDLHLRQRQAERDRERGKTATSVTKPIASGVNVFTAPKPSDPDAMQVDAARTKEDFTREMRGRCYGCGSGTHVKKDGHHERDICGHCKKLGHREGVCMDKFLGRRPKAQTAAATGGAEDPGPSHANDDHALLLQMIEQQKVLAARMDELQKSF